MTELARHAREFFQKHPQLALVDPWLPALRIQKID
jgi:hypothetical protein